MDNDNLNENPSKASPRTEAATRSDTDIGEEVATGVGSGTRQAIRNPGDPRRWVWTLNSLLMVCAGISLYSASSFAPALAFFALFVGVAGAIPYGLTAASIDYFKNHLARINKVVLLILSALPVWQLSLFLLEGVEIPIIQHLVSLVVILALCCLALAVDSKKKDYDQHSLSQHLALKAIDNASWVYSFILGIIIALLICLYIRVVHPQSFLDIKLLSRGLIPPLTLMLFCAGLSDLLYRYWLVLRQLYDDQSALALLLQRLRHQSRTVILESVYTSIDRSGELGRYLVWAIPILGFIGTVLGISLAAQGMGSMLSSQSQEYSEVLTKALEPLGIAFDTTLVALSLSLVLALIQSWHNTWQDRRIGFLIDSHSPVSSN